VTSPQPPSFWQRIAAAQERDECLPGLLPNDSPVFATTARRIHGIGPRAHFLYERLFYRLNIIHLVPGTGPPEVMLA
jgi:hypothetical protein